MADTHHGQLLKLAEVAERLRVSGSKVTEFIATGELESLKIDRSRRVSEGQLEAFIARRAAASRTA